MSAVKKEEKQWLFFPVVSAGNSVLVTDLLPATEYQFRVMAQNKVGSGPFSDIATSKTLGKLQPCVRSFKNQLKWIDKSCFLSCIDLLPFKTGSWGWDVVIISLHHALQPDIASWVRYV